MAAKLSYNRTLCSHKAGSFVFILAATLFLCSSYVLAADSVRNKSSVTSKGTEMGANSVPPRYRVFSLRHIPAEQGKKYLAEAKIGTVSQLPGSNALLVTAQRRELIKASAILKLVDAKEPFVIKAFFPSWGVKNLPSNAQIAAKVGNISIGSFSEPPVLAAKSKAIIDIHNDAVIAVAPARELDKIITAIEELQKVRAPAASFLPAPPLLFAKQSEGASKTAGVADQGEAEESESDELFDKLLGSLAEAEKRMAESRQAETEPNEPGTVVIVPEPNAPSVGPEQPKEPDLLAAILERLTALEVAVKRGPEPQREPQPPEKQVAVKVEKPGEVVEREPIGNGDEMLELDLPPKINIIQLLDLVSEFLGYDYMYDPVDVAGLKGEVTITIRKIKVKHLYPLLESVLKFKGFVMTRREGSNLLTVVPVAKAPVIDPPLRSEQAKMEIGDVVITRVFELKDIDTASAQTLLAGMKLGVSITPIPEAKQLIVTEYAYRMARIKELLEMIDKPGEPKKFRSRELKYTMATALAPKIKILAEQLGTVSITIGAPTAAKPRLPSAPRLGESAAARRARLVREAAAARAAARAAAARGAAVGPAAAKPTVYLDADERTNRILMIGLAEQLAIVDELIDTLDVEKPDLRTLRLYEIQHVGAEEVENKLGEIGIIGGGQPGARGPTRTPPTKAGRPTTPVTTRTAAIGEPLVEEPQVVIIESTNSLLVNATDEQHTQIATIISYVDSEALEITIPYVVYPLENQDPEDLATILNKLVTETTTKEEKGAKIVTTKKIIEEQITIIPDKNTFSLIVYASKKNQQWVESLIKQLDKRRPQVLIDVTLVQITKDDIFNFDLSLLGSYPNLEYTSGQTGASGSVIDLLLDPARDRDRFFDFDTTAGHFTGFYGDRAINALLTAVETKQYGRVMSRPKLLVNDNETGSIITSKTTFIERTQTSIIGTETPQTTEQQIFDDYSAGVTLTITPHISEGDMLRLEITLNRSGFDPETLGKEKPPDRSDADVTTIVTVPNKSTIILGGMENVEQGKGGDKVPILGDLPFIGGAFRSISRTDTHNKLYIFIKAHILRPGGETALADLKEVSRKNREAFERLEEEMQKYEDWPGIKPKPMDPLQILEQD